MHHPTYLTCKEFGAAFLTPMLTRYVRALGSQTGAFMPVCLAREGWLLQQLLEQLQHDQLIELPAKPVYLKVSRTLLYRALLGQALLWPIALKNGFRGSFISLFSSRFGLQRYEIEAAFPPLMWEMQVRLPEDQDDLVKMLAPYHEKLRQLVAPTLDGLRHYCTSQGLDAQSTPMLLDVGYSGTIQKLLTQVLQRDTRGFYFIATKPGISQVGEYKAEMTGAFKEGVSLGDGYHMLDRSLFIECLLTAPHGQVVDIRRQLDGSFRFYYGRKAATQRHYQDLQAVHQGAMEGVGQALRQGVDYEVAEIEHLYHGFLKSRNAIPPGVWHLFTADDDISGNGIVNPLDLFGI